MYLCPYIRVQRCWPTFLCVWKFDIKLGVLVYGWDGVSKVSFNFLHTFSIVENVYTYLYIYSKIVTKILMGLKIWYQVGGPGHKFQNYSRYFTTTWEAFLSEKSIYGWDGWDGMVYQKCPSNFFILCGYIEHVYTYFYIYSKIVNKILMGFKISCKVGGRGQKLQN